MKSVKTFLLSSLLRNRIVLVLLLLVATATTTTRLCLATNNETSLITTTTMEEPSRARTLSRPFIVPCGNNVCNKRNEYCCNESCGICAPINGSCIEKFCINKPASAPNYSIPKPHPIIPRRMPRRIPRRTPRRTPRRIPRQSFQPRPRNQLPIKTKLPIPPFTKLPFCTVDTDCPHRDGRANVHCIKNECVEKYERPTLPP